MRVIIGSDHGGLALKNEIKDYVAELGHEVVDVGTNSNQSVDYPDFGKLVAEKVAAGEAEQGILVCGTGIGMSITANKVKGIRAALCTDCFMAEMARRHNDANVLVLGGRVLGGELAKKIVHEYLTTDFEGGRHARRLEKIAGLEK